MSCAACQARVEKAVSAVPGVTACSVSLLTNSMGVEGDVSPSQIIEAVTNAGYGAEVKGAAKESSGSLTARIAAEEDALKDRETPKMRKRLIASLGFLLVLMYFSMGHMMWGWPLPSFFNDNHIAMGLIQMLLAAIVMVINQKFFTSGFPCARCTEYGHTDCDGVERRFYIFDDHALCDDTCPGRREHGARGPVYDGILFRVGSHDPYSDHGR